MAESTTTTAAAAAARRRRDGRRRSGSGGDDDTSTDSRSGDDDDAGAGARDDDDGDGDGDDNSDGDGDDGSDTSDVVEVFESRQAQVAAAMLTSDLYASKTDFDFEIEDDDEKEEEKPPEPVVPVKRNQILSSNLVSRRKKGKDNIRRTTALGILGTSTHAGGGGGDGGGGGGGRVGGRVAPARRHSSIDDIRLSAHKIAELGRGHATGGAAVSGGGGGARGNATGSRSGPALDGTSTATGTRKSVDGGGGGSGGSRAVIVRTAPARRHSSMDDIKLSAHKIAELRSGHSTDSGVGGGGTGGSGWNDTAAEQVRRRPERRVVPPRRSRSNDLVELRLTNHSSASTNRDDRRQTTGGGDNSSHGGGGGNSVGSTSTSRSNNKKTPTDMNASGSTLFSRSRRGRRTIDSGGGGDGGDEGSRRGQRSTHRMNQDRDDDGDSIVTNGSSKTDNDRRNNPSSSRKIDAGEEGIVSRRGRRRGHHRNRTESDQGEDSNGASYREGRIALKNDSVSSGMDYGNTAGRSSSRLEDSGRSSRRRGRRDRSQSVSRSKSPAAGDPSRAEERRRPLRRSKSAEGGSLHRMRSVSPKNERSIPQASSRDRRGNDHDRDRRSGRSRSRNRTKLDQAADDERPLSSGNLTKPSSSSSRSRDKHSTSTSHQPRYDQKSSNRKKKYATKENPDHHSNEEGANRMEPNVRADKKKKSSRVRADAANRDDGNSSDDDETVSTMTSNKSSNSVSKKTSTTMLLHNLLKVTSKNRNDETTKRGKKTESDQKEGSTDPAPKQATVDRSEKISSVEAEKDTDDTTDKKSKKWSGIRSGLEFTRRLVANKDEMAKRDSGKKKGNEEKDCAVHKGVQSMDTKTDRSNVEDSLVPTLSPVDDERPKKSSNWNIAAKLTMSKKGKNEGKDPSHDQNDGQDHSRNLARSTSKEKPKKANKWSLAAMTKNKKEEEAESEDNDMNYGLMDSLNSFSEEAIQDLREVWHNNDSEDDTKPERPVLSKAGRTTSIKAVSDRRAIFESLSQPSMRFDFSDNSMKMALPTQKPLSIIQDKIEQDVGSDEESYSSTSLDLDDPVPLKASIKKDKESQGDKDHSVDLEEMNLSTRSTTSNPPDRRLVFSTLAEPSMKFDFSNSRLQKSSESMQVSVQSIREEQYGEGNSEKEEASNSNNESNRLKKSLPRTGDMTSTENSSSSEEDGVQVDSFDIETAMQISPGHGDGCIQIDFDAPRGDASQAANVRAHKLKRDTSIFGFQVEGAVDLSMKQSRSEKSAALEECLDETEKSKIRAITKVKNEGQRDEYSDGKSVLPLAPDDSVCIRLTEQLRASQERVKNARESLRALQQEVHSKKHRYGEAQRKRELAFKALERKKIVLEREMK